MEEQKQTLAIIYLIFCFSSLTVGVLLVVTLVVVVLPDVEDAFNVRNTSSSSSEEECIFRRNLA